MLLMMRVVIITVIKIVIMTLIIMLVAMDGMIMPMVE